MSAAFDALVNRVRERAKCEGTHLRGTRALEGPRFWNATLTHNNNNNNRALAQSPRRGEVHEVRKIWSALIRSLTHTCARHTSEQVQQRARVCLHDNNNNKRSNNCSSNNNDGNDRTILASRSARAAIAAATATTTTTATATTTTATISHTADMNMKYWSRMAATTSATASTAAAATKSKAAPTAEEQFTALVELTAAQLTSARLMLAEEAKKMRAAASAPSMLAAGSSNGRCRSLSSTWETTDSDDIGDDASDVEEYDGDDPMGMTSDARAQSAAAAEAAARRNLFTSACDYDDDTEHEESKDAFYDLAHARDVASLARVSSSNTLPILRRMAASSNSSAASSTGVDPTTATYPSVLPAMRVSGRRRSNSQNARNRRRRTRSESAASGVSNGSNSQRSSSSSSSGSSLHRERRLRIISPIGSKIFFSGWVRGQPAEVLWEVFDKSVEAVRIELCNVGWDVPTPVAQHVANDGRHVWRRVVWGLPIEEGYYVNIYDATHPEQLDADGKLPLLAQSERFAVTG